MDDLTLFLMSRKGLRVLEALLPNYQELISAVIVASDDKIREDSYSDIVKLCTEKRVPCYDRKEKPALNSKYFLAVSWRWLIHDSEGRLIVLHDSILPKYRGFNPLVTALINGDTEIGVTALWATSDYDKGDIIDQEVRSIQYPIRINDAIDVVSESYMAICLNIAKKISGGKNLNSIAQDEKKSSYSLWRDNADYQIDWKMSAERIKRQVDAQGFPFCGASSLMNGEEIRIFDAEPLEDVFIVNRDVGKVIFMQEGCPVVVCGKGLLKVTKATTGENGKSILPMQKFRTRFE